MKNIFKILGKSFGLSLMALALVVVTGAGSAEAVLTSTATSTTSDGVLTLTGAATSAWSLSAGDLTVSAGAGAVNLTATGATAGDMAFTVGDDFTINGAATSLYNIGAATTGGTIIIGGTAQTGLISIGDTTSSTVTEISIGGGDGIKTAINIGDGAGANGINIGGAASNIVLTDAQWGVTGPGVATFVNALVTAHADTGVDVVAAGALSLGNTTATSVSICNDSPNCDSVLIATEADGGTITIGNASNTAVSITDDNWSVTTAGVATFVNAKVSASATLGLDVGAAGNLQLGGVTATTVGVGSAAVTAITLDSADTDAGLVLPLTSVSGAEMVSNTVTATQLAATVTLADADFVDLGAIVMNDAAAQGLRLPNSAGAPTAITANPEGHIAWDATNDVLYVSNGAGWGAITPNVASANTWTNVNTFQDNEIFTFAGDEDIAITSDAAATANIINLTVTPSASAGTVQGLKIDQASSANTNGVDTMIELDNSDDGLAVTSGILFTSAGAAFTTAINASASQIVTALDLGANAVEATELDFNIAPTGATSSITSTASADAEDLTISVAGAFNASLLLASAGTGVDAIGLSATAGGIKISTASTAASALDIDATGVVAGNAITIDTTDGGILIAAAGAANGDVTVTAVDDLTLNAGSTGSLVNLGTNAHANTIVIGNTTGATSLSLVYGTGALLATPTTAPASTALVQNQFGSFTTPSYGGGGTSNAFTEAGLRATAIVACSIVTSANSVSANKVVPGAGTLTVTFSADPGAATTLNCIFHNI